MAEHGDPLVVAVRVSLQIIHSPAQAPRPSTDSTPLVGSGPFLSFLVEQRVDAVLVAVVVIGVEVAAVHGGQAVAACDDFGDGPAAC